MVDVGAMLRTHVTVGLCAAASIAAGLVFLRDGDAPRAAAGGSCSPLSESSFTTGTLHDLRSFADAMVIVRAVRQEIPPPPEGPEGWAGLGGADRSDRYGAGRASALAPSEGAGAAAKVPLQRLGLVW
jgi:hypothetical protein